MVGRFDPESVDLADVARWLQAACGSSALGAVTGRTVMRDEVVRRLGCSLLEGEQIIDTMVARGFLVEHRLDDGRIHWVIEEV